MQGVARIIQNTIVVCVGKLHSCLMLQHTIRGQSIKKPNIFYVYVPPNGIKRCNRRNYSCGLMLRNTLHSNRLTGRFFQEYLPWNIKGFLTAANCLLHNKTTNFILFRLFNKVLSSNSIELSDYLQ
jgi:hypothetical protein